MTASPCLGYLRIKQYSQIWIAWWTNGIDFSVLVSANQPLSFDKYNCDRRIFECKKSLFTTSGGSVFWVWFQAPKGRLSFWAGSLQNWWTYAFTLKLIVALITSISYCWLVHNVCLPPGVEINLRERVPWEKLHI